MVAWHIAGSALYFDTQFKQAVFVAVMVGAPLWLIRRPYLQRPLVAAQRRDAGEARRETLYIGAAALAVAVAFAVLRNLL